MAMVPCIHMAEVIAAGVIAEVIAEVIAAGVRVVAAMGEERQSR